MGQDAEGNKDEGNEDNYEYETDNGENKKNATRNLPPFWFVVNNSFLYSASNFMIIHRKDVLKRRC